LSSLGDKKACKTTKNRKLLTGMCHGVEPSNGTYVNF